MKSAFYFLVLIVLFSITINGQTQRCSTPNPTQIVYSQQLYRVAGDITIPVFFHVIYTSTDNVTNTQLQDQINELNTAYSNSRFSFYTGGITRTQNSAWSYFQRGSQTETNMTNALAVDPKYSFNVYIVELSSTVFGWVINWPWDVAEESLQNGVVINYGSLPGGNIANFNEGKTLVHEGGHYLGLYHTFQNGCTSPGDEVDDTPYHLANYNCPSENTNTCSQIGNDPVHNYMNYTSDPCMYELTSGQLARIDAIVGEYKPNLGLPASATVSPTTNNVGSVKADTYVTGSFTIYNTGGTTLNLTIQSQTNFDLDPSNSITYEPVIYRTISPDSYITVNYDGYMGGAVDYGSFTSTITIIDNANSISKTHTVIGTLLLPDFCYGETTALAASPEELLFDKAFVDFYVADTLQVETKNGGKREKKSIKERLDFAYKLLKKDKTEKIANICKDIIELYPESEMGISFYAMGLLWEAAYSDIEAPDFSEKDFKSYLKELTEKKEKYKINGYAQLILSLLDVGNDIEGLEKLFSDYEYDGLKELALFHQFIHYYIYKQDNETARKVSDQLDKMFVDSRYGYQAHLIFGDEGYTLEGLKELLKKKQESLLAKRGESKNDILSEIPKEYKLFNNYPNPFNPSTTIKYSVPKVSNVKLQVYNMMGQLIKTLVNETKAPGFYSVVWNGTNENDSKVASGIYFYRFESENFVANNKMILIK